MKTKVVIHENRVKIYFREGKHFIRYNTGIPVSGKFQFYRNDPQNYFNPTSNEHIEYNKKLKAIQELIEQIVDENLGKFGIILTNEFVRRRIYKTHNEKVFTKSTFLSITRISLCLNLNITKTIILPNYPGKTTLL